MKMKEKEILARWRKIGTVIAKEIEENADFAAKMNAALGVEPTAAPSTAPPKKKNRRDPAKLDPFALLEQGEEVLAGQLAELSVEELKDIVSEYGMDSSRLALKWKDRIRLETLIIDTTKRKASRGNAFWSAQTPPEERD